jgi:YcxB-like protein
MSEPPPIPPTVTARRGISYCLTRGDLFINALTVIYRNRILKVFIPASLLVNIGIITLQRIGREPGSAIARTAFFQCAVLMGVIIVSLCFMGLIAAFVTTRGVLGEHALEITPQGLIERTAVNETLHKWTSVSRIFSQCGYLYIYVGELKCHIVPKRGFPENEISDFERDLRARTGNA